MLKWLWFASGLLVGLTVLSITKASVPTGRVTDDTIMSQKLSEIKIRKQGRLDFDAEVAQLAGIEDRYHEKLPRLGNESPLSNAMKRIAKVKYKASASLKRSR